MGNCGLEAIPKEVLDLPDSINHINFGSLYNLKNNKVKQNKNQGARNNFSLNTDSFDLFSQLPSIKTLEIYACSIGDKGAQEAVRTHLVIT
ncbi:MAG: hypothetical protein JKY19_04330 [Alcanivoracaceae bacterium]|nr:hypothetical protein [Alcanivoracaceae bacterium]